MGNGGSNEAEKQETEKWETVVRSRPPSIDYLKNSCLFTHHEIKMLYRGFKEVCPRGVMNEEELRHAFFTLFPMADSVEYASYVFQTLDANGDGYVTFEEFLNSVSLLSRGSMSERLGWLFRLYDRSEPHGRVTEPDVRQIVYATHTLLGSATQPPFDAADVETHAMDAFQKLRPSSTSTEISLEDFVKICKTDPDISASFRSFTTVMRRKSTRDHQALKMPVST